MPGHHHASRTAIISEAFQRLQQAQNADEARALVEALIAEKKTGGIPATVTGDTGKQRHPQQHPARSSGFTVEGRLLDDAAHDMSQPGWEKTLHDVAAPRHYPKNLELLSLYCTVGTFVQSAAVIEACFHLIELDGQESQHRGSGGGGNGHPHSVVADSDEDNINRMSARNVSGETAPTQHLRLHHSSPMRLVLGMLWWLPEKWACCAPNEWERAGAIAHTFEHLLRKFASLHVTTSSLSEGDSSNSGTVARERERNVCINDIVLFVARRWNRNVHFRRYNDFHKAASCGFRHNDHQTTTTTTAFNNNPASSSNSDPIWLMHLKAMIADPIAALIAATDEWQRLAPAWSQISHDIWLQSCSRLTSVRLLTLTTRIDSEDDQRGEQFSSWEQQCHHIMTESAAAGVRLDATLVLLRVTMMAEPPTRALFHNSSNSPSQASPNSATNELQRKEWRAQWENTKIKNNNSEEELPAPNTAGVVVTNFKWVERYTSAATDNRRHPQALSGVSKEMLFLWAYCCWLFDDDDDSKQHSDAEALYRYMAPVWSELLSRRSCGIFATAVVKCFTAKLGYHPAAAVVEAVRTVASELLLVLWWNISPRAASPWLLRLATCRGDSAREGIHKIVHDMAELCGSSVAQAIQFDDANDGTMVGDSSRLLHHGRDPQRMVAPQQTSQNCGFPKWLAIFISDPLLLQR